MLIHPLPVPPDKQLSRLDMSMNAKLNEASLPSACEVSNLKIVDEQQSVVVRSSERASATPSTPESIQVSRCPQSTNPLVATHSMNVEIGNLVICSQPQPLASIEVPVPQVTSMLVGLSHEAILDMFRTFEMEDLQGADADHRAQEWRKLTGFIIRGLNTMPGLELGCTRTFSEIFEGILILVHWNRACRTISDYWVLARTAYMCFTGRSMCDKIIGWLFPTPELQSFEEVVTTMRDAMDMGKTLVECELTKRLRKMYTFLLVQGVLKRMGMETTESEFVFLSKKTTSIKYGSTFNMWYHVVDTTIFVCERIVTYRKTGSIEAFIRDGSECDDWLVVADKLLALAPFTANLEAHGTTYFRFLSDLNDSIDRGQAIVKAFRAMGAERSNPVMRKLGALMLMKNSEVTKRASLQSRHAPLGVLIFGHSGVAKSSFTKVLYHAYGSLFGLERDDHYLYTRSPANEYWSNYDSSMWAIQMDDIAFLKPSATSDVDPTLKELLNVVNNVPYTPPQAALEDKGKTPILAKLVLATTNCENLNAHEYFHCPLAVRRRLPYVIEVEPKAVYKQANGVFIEPESLPSAEPGFPNFWDITVKRIVPSIQNDGSEQATLEIVEKFTEITEFIKHFGAFAKQHRANQSKGEAAEEFVKQVELCPVCCCYKEDCQCALQVGEWLWFETLSYYFMYLYIEVLTFWFGFRWFHKLAAYLARINCVGRFLGKYVFVHLPVEEFVRVYLTAKRVVHDNRTTLALSFLTLLSTALSIYAYAANVRANRAEATVKRQAEGEETDDEYEDFMFAQGNIMGTTEEDFATATTSNVWYRDHVELQTFDLPLSSGSLVGKQPEELRDMFARNMVSIAIKALDGPYRGNTRGFFYRGSSLVMNRHTLKGGEFELTILRGVREAGVKPVLTLRVKLSDFATDPAHDMAVLYVASMAPARDLSKFWCEDVIPVSKMVGIGRAKSGECSHRVLHGVSFFHMPLKDLEGEYPILVGAAGEETQAGDCGMLYMADTPRGATFVGFHVAGYGTKAGVMRVFRKDLDTLCERVQPSATVVSGEGEPLLSLQDKPVLLDPHTKSVFRYIENGTAEQFGRLPGFLPRPRSKVRSTPLREVMEEHFGAPCGFTAPVMDGWEPLRNNVKEMVVPEVKYDAAILDRCKRAFLAEILAELPEKWEGQLLELSDLAAVNGLPGVKFIDKLNTNSSMGFPWNKSKKQFLDEIHTDRYPDGVDFPPEIWERVRHVEAEYDAGRRAYPIFMGHLKDEPVTYAKRAAKKTRLFAGGPVHWSIVVRKTLLSFVKLVQENKLTFEAGPGTVCQSIEWQELKDFLTQFGLERIIAGDYSKFDKHMIADFIMAAYWIIAEIHKAAGHSDAMYRKIMGIGTDVAYPVMNIRGELVMFYGTNPSGHPLTVIINSLVNSLYIRYAFAVLGYNVERFKRFVALMTYGDDNAMGVSIEVPLFTHTAIQKVLGEIGVIYTMADKESKSTAYVHINDVSFLKRKWKFDADIGAYVCPLEEDSIKKSLMCWLPSNTISPEAQMVAVMQSAVNEYFWYGKEVFEGQRAFLMECAAKEPYVHYVQDSTFPTWQELKERFWGASC